VRHGPAGLEQRSQQEDPGDPLLARGERHRAAGYRFRAPPHQEPKRFVTRSVVAARGPGSLAHTPHR
jgi:hypothetical protein